MQLGLRSWSSRLRSISAPAMLSSILSARSGNEIVAPCSSSGVYHQHLTTSNNSRLSSKFSVQTGQRQSDESRPSSLPWCHCQGSGKMLHCPLKHSTISCIGGNIENTERQQPGYHSTSGLFWQRRFYATKKATTEKGKVLSKPARSGARSRLYPSKQQESGSKTKSPLPPERPTTRAKSEDKDGNKKQNIEMKQKMEKKPKPSKSTGTGTKKTTTKVIPSPSASSSAQKLKEEEETKKIVEKFSAKLNFNKNENKNEEEKLVGQQEGKVAAVSARPSAEQPDAIDLLPSTPVTPIQQPQQRQQEQEQQSLRGEDIGNENLDETINKLQRSLKQELRTLSLMKASTNWEQSSSLSSSRTRSKGAVLPDEDITIINTQPTPGKLVVEVQVDQEEDDEEEGIGFGGVTIGKAVGEAWDPDKLTVLALQDAIMKIRERQLKQDREATEAQNVEMEKRDVSTGEGHNEAVREMDATSQRWEEKGSVSDEGGSLQQSSSSASQSAKASSFKEISFSHTDVPIPENHKKLLKYVLEIADKTKHAIRVLWAGSKVGHSSKNAQPTFVVQGLVDYAKDTLEELGDTDEPMNCLSFCRKTPEEAFKAAAAHVFRWIFFSFCNVDIPHPSTHKPEFTPELDTLVWSFLEAMFSASPFEFPIQFSRLQLIIRPAPGQNDNLFDVALSEGGEFIASSNSSGILHAIRCTLEQGILFYTAKAASSSSTNVEHDSNVAAEASKEDEGARRVETLRRSLKKISEQQATSTVGFCRNMSPALQPSLLLDVCLQDFFGIRLERCPANVLSLVSGWKVALHLPRRNEGGNSFSTSLGFALGRSPDSTKFAKKKSARNFACAAAIKDNFPKVFDLAKDDAEFRAAAQQQQQQQHSNAANPPTKPVRTEFVAPSPPTSQQQQQQAASPSTFSTGLSPLGEETARSNDDSLSSKTPFDLLCHFFHAKCPTKELKVQQTPITKVNAGTSQTLWETVLYLGAPGDSEKDRSVVAEFVAGKKLPSLQGASCVALERMFSDEPSVEPVVQKAKAEVLTASVPQISRNSDRPTGVGSGSSRGGKRVFEHRGAVGRSTYANSTLGPTRSLLAVYRSALREYAEGQKELATSLQEEEVEESCAAAAKDEAYVERIVEEFSSTGGRFSRGKEEIAEPTTASSTAAEDDSVATETKADASIWRGRIYISGKLVADVKDTSQLSCTLRVLHVAFSRTFTSEEQMTRRLRLSLHPVPNVAAAKTFGGGENINNCTVKEAFSFFKEWTTYCFGGDVRVKTTFEDSPSLSICISVAGKEYILATASFATESFNSALKRAIIQAFRDHIQYAAEKDRVWETLNTQLLRYESAPLLKDDEEVDYELFTGRVLARQEDGENTETNAEGAPLQRISSSLVWTTSDADPDCILSKKMKLVASLRKILQSAKEGKGETVVNPVAESSSTCDSNDERNDTEPYPNVAEGKDKEEEAACRTDPAADSDETKKAATVSSGSLSIKVFCKYLYLSATQSNTLLSRISLFEDNENLLETIQIEISTSYTTILAMLQCVDDHFQKTVQSEINRLKETIASRIPSGSSDDSLSSSSVQEPSALLQLLREIEALQEAYQKVSDSVPPRFTIRNLQGDGERAVKLLVLFYLGWNATFSSRCNKKWVVLLTVSPLPRAETSAVELQDGDDTSTSAVTKRHPQPPPMTDPSKPAFYIFTHVEPAGLKQEQAINKAVYRFLANNYKDVVTFMPSTEKDKRDIEKAKENSFTKNSQSFSSHNQSSPSGRRMWSKDELQDWPSIDSLSTSTAQRKGRQDAQQSTNTLRSYLARTLREKSKAVLRVEETRVGGGYLVRLYAAPILLDGTMDLQSEKEIGIGKNMGRKKAVSEACYRVLQQIYPGDLHKAVSETPSILDELVE